MKTMNTKHLLASLALASVVLSTSLPLWAQSSAQVGRTGTVVGDAQLSATQFAAADQLAQDVPQNVAESRRRQREAAAGLADSADATVTAVDARTGTALIKTKDGTAMRLEKIVARAPGSNPSQAQVIAFSALDSGKRAEMTEDLNVMAKLIDDAVSDQRDAATPRAMGINVSTLFADGTSPRSLYIEGHGAIFHAAVKFPLKPTEKKETPAASKPLKNSPWEEARRDIYGGPEADPEWIRSADGKHEEYSEERVESLKRSIIKALGNANNFRHLGQDETITAVIRSSVGGGRRVALPVVAPRSATTGTGTGRFGGGEGFSVGRFGGSLGSGYAYGTGNRSGELEGGGDEHTMTIRVKKSDADSLANGRINEEEFRKRATVTVY